MLNLADILESLTGTRPVDASLIINEASVDSRLVLPGGMFVALPGERVDGHEFIIHAFDKGAHIALIQKDLPSDFSVIDLRGGPLCGPINFTTPQPPFCLRVEDSLKALQTIAKFQRRKLNVRVIGVTGSVGKSTTKELITEVLNQRFRTMKNPGNFNNEIGLPLSLLRLGDGHEYAVLEMGFYIPGEISFLCDLALPQVGVITNIGTVHAERAGSQDVIANGKSELIQSLPNAPEGIAVLNYDDPWVRPMANKTRAQIFYYGLDPNAHLWADKIESQGLEGLRFQLHYQNDVIPIQAPLIGRHSVYTALRAAAIGLIEGMTWQEISAGLRFSHNQLRLVAAQTASGALLIDDTYNSSPESALAALDLLSEMKGRKIAVLGDMLELGPYEKQGHDLVGERAAEICDQVITVGSLGKGISESAMKAGMVAPSVLWMPTVDEIIYYLPAYLQEGDVVLIKGSRGMHMERIVSALEVNP